MWCTQEGREKINGVAMKRRRDRGPKLRCVALRECALGSDAVQGKTQGGRRHYSMQGYFALLLLLLLVILPLARRHNGSPDCNLMETQECADRTDDKDKSW